MLLTLRCVHAKDKAMALGLIQFAIGLFGNLQFAKFFFLNFKINLKCDILFQITAANVPCPIIYGAVVDSACFVWDRTCGEQGACWLYDAKTFRVSFHGNSALLVPY